MFNQFCYCAQLDKEIQSSDKEYKYIDKCKRMWVIKDSIRHIPSELLFKNGNDSNVLTHMILEALLKTTIDNRPQLIQKILITGGCTISLKGFKRRLLYEIDSLLEKSSKYSTLLGLKNKFNIIESPKFNHYTLSWIGASILTSLNVNMEPIMSKD